MTQQFRRLLALGLALLVGNSAAASPFAPSPIRVMADEPLGVRQLAGSASCGVSGCHPDIAEQWNSSAHHFSSFNNPFYRAAVDALMESEGGMEKANWCAGCHDPALLLSGGFNEDLDPNSALAVEGVSCLICHATDDDIDLRGNGGYALRSIDAVPAADSKTEFMKKLGRAWLRMRPGPHKKMLLRPIHQRAEFCLSCHKVSVPPEVNDYRWKRGQNEYDAWHHSGVSGNNAASFHFRRNPATCIQCHMPEVDSDDKGHDDGRVASHRFAAANSALPALRGDSAQLLATEEFLQRGAMRLWLGGVSVNDGIIVAPEELIAAPDDELRFYIVVRNLNVGHHFPGGTTDSQEAWLHVRILDADGKLLLESGHLDSAGELSSNTRAYRARLLDKNAELLERRQVQDWVATAYSLTIAPGTSDVARYRIRLGPNAALPLHVEARLRYRKFHPSFSNWVFAQIASQEAVEIPIVDVASGSWNLGHRERLEAKTEADRWNDLGVALFLQKDRQRCLDAFAAAAQLDGSRADFWINQARVAWSDGDLIAADQFLDQAAQRDSKHPTLWLLRARVLASRGDQSAAMDRYRQILGELPLDRGVWIELANTQFLAGLYRDALTSFDRVLVIDPESLAAHNGRLRCLRALGEDFDDALAAVDRYKASELEGAIAGRWLGKYTDEHRASLPVWEYAP